ncbi:hypothetical protein PSFL_24810 [Pseudomonas sp. DD1]
MTVAEKVEVDRRIQPLTIQRRQLQISHATDLAVIQRDFRIAVGRVVSPHMGLAWGRYAAHATAGIVHMQLQPVDAPAACHHLIPAVGVADLFIAFNQSLQPVAGVCQHHRRLTAPGRQYLTGLGIVLVAVLEGTGLHCGQLLKTIVGIGLARRVCLQVARRVIRQGDILRRACVGQPGQLSGIGTGKITLAGVLRAVGKRRDNPSNVIEAVKAEILPDNATPQMILGVFGPRAAIGLEPQKGIVGEGFADHQA